VRAMSPDPPDTTGEHVAPEGRARDEPVIRSLGEPGDLGWVVMAHGEPYTAELGWDVSFETLVARIVADYASGHDREREAGWIAEQGGRPAAWRLCADRDAKGLRVAVPGSRRWLLQSAQRQEVLM
jgi:hypothetical protein